jgi:nicotinamidase-related amidase
MTGSRDCSLLVVDVQQGLFEQSTPIYRAEELLENITSLIDQAHSTNTPVFYIQHSGSNTLVRGTPQWKLHPRLQPMSTDNIVHKQHGNAFEETTLDGSLRAKNITTVVVTGLVTHGCVRATCLGALKSGYKVILVKDAHSNFSKQAAQRIDELNQKLSEKKVELRSTAMVDFQKGAG